MIRSFVIALLLTLSAASSDCDQGRTISYSGVARCNFVFKHGDFFLCDKLQEGSDSNWGSCFSYCCDQLAPDEADCEALEMCQDYWDKLSTQTHSITLGLSIGGSVGLFLALSLCLCRRCPLRRCLANSQCCLDRNEETPNQMQAKVQVEIMLTQTGGRASLLQNMMEYSSTIKKEDICPICLEGQPNLMFACAHFYHKKCGKLTVDIKDECSLCRSKQIRPFRVYCCRCMCRYNQVSQLSTKEEEICLDCSRQQRFPSPNPYLCDQDQL